MRRGPFAISAVLFSADLEPIALAESVHRMFASNDYCLGTRIELECWLLKLCSLTISNAASLCLKNMLTARADDLLSCIG